jgi:hypothetical protein
MRLVTEFTEVVLPPLFAELSSFDLLKVIKENYLSELMKRQHLLEKQKNVNYFLNFSSLSLSVCLSHNVISISLYYMIVKDSLLTILLSYNHTDDFFSAQPTSTH